VRLCEKRPSDSRNGFTRWPWISLPLLELLEVMRSADGGELMRRLLATILQLLVDAEATAFVGAEPHERSVARTNRRNGTRDKLVATATGDITVKIPKVRAGSFFPSLLAPRRRVDVALHAVVMRPGSKGCRPVRSTTWLPRSVSSPASPSPK
jgi:transposase-like protein